MRTADQQHAITRVSAELETAVGPLRGRVLRDIRRDDRRIWGVCAVAGGRRSGRAPAGARNHSRRHRSRAVAPAMRMKSWRSLGLLLDAAGLVSGESTSLGAGARRVIVRRYLLPGRMVRAVFVLDG
jgi:hypothetical protein